MSKASQIVILCEDKAHEVFVKRFLKRGWKIKDRAIRVPEYPMSRGSGKKHVEESISVEAEALRKRRASTILLVMRDADEDDVDKAKAILDGKIVPPRGDSEPIVFVVPKWHIETWIAYLDGKEADESDKDTYKRLYGDISVRKGAHAIIDKLAMHCREKKALKSPPNSLLAACKEFERIRGVL